uniref:Uncharacterized protein n=1 Tax=Rhizophora mucronata TaxID=61149 RepID=A0A2P2QR70_RHIMU
MALIVMGLLLDLGLFAQVSNILFYLGVAYGKP